MQHLISLLLCIAPLAVAASKLQPATASSAAMLVASDPTRVALDVNSTTLKCEQINDNDLTVEQMVIPGEGVYYREGQPILPAISRFVVIPPDKSVELVVREGEARFVQAEFPLAICDEKGLDGVGSELQRDNANELIPPATAYISEPMVIRGVRLVQVTTYPVQFDPQSQSYIIRDSLAVELRFGDETPVNPALHPVRRNRSRTFLKFIQSLAINGEVVGRDDPDYDVAPEYVGHYLVVVHANLLQYAAPFIEWRRKSGYKVDILSVPSNNARDAAWIKSHIQELYDSYLDQDIDPFDLLMLIGEQSNYGGDCVIATPSYGWGYACLEGGNNDPNADVGLAQWMAGNESLMTLNSGRTLGYEMTPFFNNTDWFTRAAIFSQVWGGNWNVSLHTNVRWAREMLKIRNFDDIRFHETLQNDNGNVVSGFIYDQFRDGVNLLFGRAQASGLRGSNIRATGIYPVYVNYAGHQENITWPLIREWNGRDITGPVVATNIYGAPTTYSNSLLWLETINGLIQKDLPFGWARVNAVMAPQLYIPNFPSGNFNRENTSSYGDPGLQPWLGVPKVVHADFPSRISSSTRRIDIQVVSDENDDPFEGAQVTIYAPGNMPAANNANYATYDQMFMQTQKSDGDGMARFVFNEGTEFVDDTRMYVTITGRDINPSLDTCAISVPEGAVELSRYEFEEIDGNNDEYPNPGETFSLRLTAMNIGDSNTLQDVTATVSTNSPYLEVNDDQISFNDIEPGQENEGDHPVELRFASTCPDGVSRPALRPTVNIEFSSGEENWKSAIKLEPHSPHFDVSRIIGGETIPDTIHNLEIEITNKGSAPSGDLTATLAARGIGVNILRDQSNYNNLQPGQNNRPRGDPFVIMGNSEAVPGSITQMQLILTNNIGFVDTVAFSLQVMSARERAPQGPDAYGYVCYDDTDSGWFSTPRYEWVEIDPRENDADFEGVQLDFDGQAPFDMGEALAVQLPFTTKFYGIEYEEITVATNGFITLGDQEEITNFQNWPLDRGIGGGAGMIAPFWDRLDLGQNGEVYYFHDEDHGRFIIEWSRLRHRNVGNIELKFEVVMSDPTMWVSETGDPNILFQYKSIRNEAGNDRAWIDDAPYASVGISSPFGNTGLSYSFNNQYPVTSAPLQNRRALLFTASPLRLSSYLYGQVKDAATGVGIPQARVRTRHGYIAITDDDGNWSIINAPSEVSFSITAFKIGYNDSSYFDLEVGENDTLEINFDLLHPEFTISQEELSAVLDEGQEIRIGFDLTNTGNGPLVWNAEKCLVGDANAAPWEIRRVYNVSQATGDERIEGVVFAGNHFYVSGANDLDPNMVYILNRDGELTGHWAQTGSSRYGYKDLDWDGNFIWASGQDSIYCLTTDGQFVNAWLDPLNPTQYIACDSENGIIYISGTTTNILACDHDGRVLGDPLNRRGLRVYGLGYWPEDPDGYKLYILHRPMGAESFITKMNTETGDTINVTEITQLEGSMGEQSVWISNEFDVYSWVMMSIQNISNEGGGDKILIHQIDARKDWMNLDIWGGRVEAGERQELAMTFSAMGLPDTTFVGEIRFHHNADDNVMILDVALDVIGDELPAPFDLVTPIDGDTIKALPMHEGVIPLPAVTFAWQSTDDPDDLDTIHYRLNFAVGEQVISLTSIPDTTLTLNPDTLGLLINFDLPITWWVEALSGRAVVSSNLHFSLIVLADDIDIGKFTIPFVFGLDPVWPNPFNGKTTIKYSLEKSAFTSLRLYDLSGRIAMNLFEGTNIAGIHKVALDCEQLTSGVYMLRLESAGRVEIQKLTLIR